MPDRSLGPKPIPLSDIVMRGHRAKMPESQSSFEPEILEGGRAISVRQEVITALRDLNVQVPRVLYLLSYANSFPGALAMSIGNGWNAAGVKKATQELLALVAKYVPKTDMEEFSKPRTRRATGVILTDEDRARLPKWPGVGPDGPSGSI